MNDSVTLGLVEAKREAVMRGELISVEEMSERMCRPRTAIEKLLNSGRLFALEVDNVNYIPAFLDAEAHIRNRLWDICEVIHPAHAESKLRFLLNVPEQADERSALDMLADEKDFRRLRSIAKAWISEWSRTVVIMLEGKHETLDIKKIPLYKAAREVDPRAYTWSRAAQAVGHNEQRSSRSVFGILTLFVYRLAPPDNLIIDSRLLLSSADGGISIGISISSGPTYILPIPSTFDVHDAGSIARRVVHHMNCGGKNGGMNAKEAAEVLQCSTSDVHRLASDKRLVRVLATPNGKFAVSLASVRSLRAAWLARTVAARQKVARLQ